MHALDSLMPTDVIRRWPEERRLVALVSAGTHPRWARWSILGEPSETIRCEHDDTSIREAISLLDGASASPSRGSCSFTSGWIVELRYELGGFFEPRSLRECPAGVTMLLHRCDRALVHDNVLDRWHTPSVDDGLLDDLRRNEPDEGGSLSALSSECGATDYATRVRRALEYIRDGDVYQVNVAHTLRAAISGSWRALGADRLESMRPWYGAYIESEPDMAVLSCSPELLVELDGVSRSVVSRPIKGTRSDAVSPDELAHSAKDAAELSMIVDLMRNDLGRVCEPGSIGVASHRQIEHHGHVHHDQGRGVWHAVSTIEGTLRRELGISDLLRACFPAGSITGAPKIRAMQIIEELERCQRGAYCGSIGFVSDSGHACFNVAIRTATLRSESSDRRDGAIEYPVGAGIVAQSRPEDEWLETLHKSAGMRGLRDLAPEIEGRPIEHAL
ncbi:MAG: anthranilate synthase component I family protein [Phycisphaerales bacterium JB043]